MKVTDDPIPYGRQEITDDDVEAVIKILRSDFLTQGPTVQLFEQAVAKCCNAEHAVAVNSATSALHLACQALGVGPSDWVWTTPITFVASANCARYCGASIDFVDIDARSYNMSVSALEEKLIKAKAQGRLPKVLIPVHFTGQPCDMEAIHALSKTYGFRIIEDASHAIGALYQGEPVGDCRYSDITVFSFHPVKIITTGEGGMALTNNAKIADQMAMMRSHGITRDPEKMTKVSDGPWYYQQVDLGYNYRMTDIHAAMGLSQLCRLKSFIARRRAIAERYNILLEGMSLVRPLQSDQGLSSWHLYPIRVEAKRRREIFDRLRNEGIGVNVHYIPVHTQPDFARYGRVEGDFPESEQYYAEAISLPLYATLTKEQQDRVVDVLRRAIS